MWNFRHNIFHVLIMTLYTGDFLNWPAFVLYQYEKNKPTRSPSLNEGYHGRAALAGSMAFFNFGAEQVWGGGQLQKSLL